MKYLIFLSYFVKTYFLGFCRVCVRSRCWDACMVVDGGTSFEFNDGAIASIMIDTEDALCTVLLEEWRTLASSAETILDPERELLEIDSTSQCCIMLEVGLFVCKSIRKKLEMLFIPLGWGNLSLIFKLFLCLLEKKCIRSLTSNFSENWHFNL